MDSIEIFEPVFNTSPYFTTIGIHKPTTRLVDVADTLLSIYNGPFADEKYFSQYAGLSKGDCLIAANISEGMPPTFFMLNDYIDLLGIYGLKIYNRTQYAKNLKVGTLAGMPDTPDTRAQGRSEIRRLNYIKPFKTIAAAEKGLVRLQSSATGSEGEAP